MFAIAASKDAWVNELWCGLEHGERWSFLFTRLLKDREVERFLSIIGKATMIDVMEDELIWEENRDGFFLVKSMYKALRPRCPKSFPWAMVWKSCVQPKICFFAWEAIWGKIITNDQLQKRGFSLANRCYLCF